MAQTRARQLKECLVGMAVALGVLTAAWAAATGETPGSAALAGQVTEHSGGLHGYIGFGHEKPPPDSHYSAGMGFYAAVWSLVDRPLANFQIGLPGTWIMPDNSDDRDTPLAPEGTLARKWKERGPTWSHVFQTVEGGLGYWAGNHFRYGPPKFSMNGTPEAYDYEIGSPGWSFFYSNEALPDHRLGIAQLSNRLLIPPDALPFEGKPNGQFLGYTWMALPLTDPTTEEPPTGDQSWTCFLSAANFKGPIAFYIPETWSKIGKLFHYPYIYGRGLDARPAVAGSGAMEINTVPRFDSTDAQGTSYTKLPKLQFPVDAHGRAFLVQDVTFYSKAALADAVRAWRNGGSPVDGRFDGRGAWKPKLSTHTPRYDQAHQPITGVERVFDTRIFEGNVWGLQWFTNSLSAIGTFPQYYKELEGKRVAVPASAVPPETRLLQQEFKLAASGPAYTSPAAPPAWPQAASLVEDDGQNAGPLIPRRGAVAAEIGCPPLALVIPEKRVVPAVRNRLVPRSIWTKQVRGHGHRATVPPLEPFRATQVIMPVRLENEHPFVPDVVEGALAKNACAQTGMMLGIGIRTRRSESAIRFRQTTHVRL